MSVPVHELLPSAAQDDRLDSWKEIAAFLQRDVRTVQRWEKQAGLPIHRHAESRLRTAYAYRSELNAWWRAQRVAEEDAVTEPAAERRGLPLGLSRRMIAGTVAVIGCTVAGAMLYLTQSAPREIPPGAAPPTAVLMTRFDDRIDDPALAGAVEEAVLLAIRRHAGLDIAPPARVSRVLRLMRREPATPLTAAAGREICLRDGALRFAVSGSIHYVGSRYFADLQAIDPPDGSVRVSVVTEAESRLALQSGLLAAAARFAEALAVAARSAPPIEPLEQVTTASLPALRLYTSAVEAAARRQWGAAEALARRAIAADDHFASAYALAGWARRQSGPARDAMPLLERALALSDGTSDAESYVIAGLHDLVAGNLPSAIAAFEARLRVQRDVHDVDPLIRAYARAGRIKEAIALAVRRGEAEPDSFYATIRAAHALLAWQGEARRAAVYVERAQRLASGAAADDRPEWAAWASAAPVFEAWIAGDPRTAIERLAPLDRSLEGRLGRERDAFATRVGFAYLGFGKVQQARRAFGHAGSPARQMNLALCALAEGDERTAREWLLQIRSHSAQRPALFARAGLTADAERGLDAIVLTDHTEGIVEVTRGLVAARRGDRGRAAAALRRGIELLRFTGEPEYFFAVEALADRWAADGDTDRAVQWLVDASTQRTHTYGAAYWTAAYWIRLNARLADLYRRQHRLADAERISTALRVLLRDADAPPLPTDTLAAR